MPRCGAELRESSPKKATDRLRPTPIGVAESEAFVNCIPVVCVAAEIRKAFPFEGKVLSVCETDEVA